MYLEDFLSIVGIILLIIFLISGIVFGIYVLEKSECRQRAEHLETDYEFGLIKGCIWKIDNQWIPAENYRYFEKNLK